jgi:rhamnogalacturonan hydrolase
MFSNFNLAFLSSFLYFSSLVKAAAVVDLALVGPSTTLSAKSIVCNVLDYGGIADNKTDIGPAILLAYSSCASGGGATLLIPTGEYSCMYCIYLMNSPDANGQQWLRKYC